MAILIDTDSEESKERRKFEQFYTELGPPGNPWKMRPFPCMMYYARRVPGDLPNAGKFATGCEIPARHMFLHDDSWQRAVSAAQAFADSCLQVANDEAERRRLMADGWAESSALAIEAAEARERAISDAAAERHFSDRKMSEKAQAEALEHDRSTFEHQPVIPQAKDRARPART